MCGQKPVFSILMEHFIHRCAYAAVQRKAHRDLCVLPSYFCCYRHHEGVCRWLASRAGPFFVWPKEEAFL